MKIHSEELIPLWASFLAGTDSCRVEWHIGTHTIPASKIEVSWAMGDSIPH
jgi:hypothetical protein